MLVSYQERNSGSVPFDFTFLPDPLEVPSHAFPPHLSLTTDTEHSEAGLHSIS